ncbi:MAG: hypothetical protein CVV25_14810 [Ignavibacteriae bacterium HGW-Ignavibacteriae-4]|jgi:hypothetical protein|nr:MAG: hypothetical protein CVV25_14810 [Ignavibacteriae bacterium HGW-Ignavibacteriae-4]
MKIEILIITAAISIALFIALFLILRQVMLWYWKINRIEDLLQEQVNILRLIHKEKLEEVESESIVDASEIEGVRFDFSQDLTDKEKSQITDKASHLKKNQLLAIHNINREVTFWYQDEYDNQTKQNNNNVFSIVAIRE